MPVLEDLVRPNLKLVICGSAVGKRSAQARAYYAGPGNKFWRTLHDVGLTPIRFSPHEFRELLTYGIGLTDLAKLASGNDDELPVGAFDVDGLKERMVSVRPGRLAFNGKKAAGVFMNIPTTNISYGRQNISLGPTEIWVLPSTSGAASGFWAIEPWQDIANGL